LGWWTGSTTIDALKSMKHLQKHYKGSSLNVFLPVVPEVLATFAQNNPGTEDFRALLAQNIFKEHNENYQPLKISCLYDAYRNLMKCLDDAYN